MKCLACDFGGSSVKYSIIDEQANMTGGGKLPAPLGSVEEFVSTVKFLYEKFKNEICGIGISLPGYIDSTTGLLVGSGAYEKLYGYRIPDLLYKGCPTLISVENDGKCAALSEAWKGALSDCKDGAVMILGSGIAGGIIKDGKIHSGRNHTAGELSYIITNPDEDSILAVSCMNAAALGLTYWTCKEKNIDLSVQDAGSMLASIDAKVNHPYKDPDHLKRIKADGKQIFKWLDNGDEAVKIVYANFIKALAITVIDVQVCYAPEKIVIGGGLSQRDSILVDVKKEIESRCEAMMISKELQPIIVRSKYLDECNLIGASYNFFLQNQLLINHDN